MASPHATGVAALVRSYQPGLGNALVQVVMEASADDIGEPGFDMGTGHGRVNAYEALLLAGLAAARAELVAEVAVDTVTAAPGSPVAVSARVENIGSVDAAAVQLQIADGDPAMGGQVLYTWTVPLIPPGGAYQGTLTLALPSAGERNVFLVADPQQQIPEVSEENNRASAPVNVMSYQHVESVIADDEGLTPVGLFVEQRSPSISGNLVVWSDNRHSLVLNDGITDIYLLDVASGVETRITSAPSAKSDPCISGNRIVWIDRRNGYNDIYMYDLSTGLETQITSDTYSRAKPKVHGDWIVWSDRRNGNSDVFAYNVSGGGPEIQITTDPAEQSMPVVYGNRVVWCDTRSGSNDLYSYTLPSGPESPIVSGDGIRFGPDIHEDTVVWSEGYLNSLRDMDIGIHLLDLAQPPAVQLTSSPGAGDFYPSVSAADVAWTRGLLRPDVFVMDLATGYSSRLTTSGTATFSAVDTSEERAVWEEYRQMAWENEMLPRYDYNIYMAQRDAFPAAPLNLVAANGGTGTINLNWNDNTEGDLAGYRVYRRLSTQAPFTLVATTTLSAFQDTGLTDGIRYYYRVCAVDAAAGESAFSNEASAVPKTLTGGSPIFRKPIPNQQP